MSDLQEYVRSELRERKLGGPQENCTLVGEMTAVLRGPDGKIKETRNVKNLVVTTGVTAIIERLDSSPTTGIPSHMAVGTSTVVASAGQTDLTSVLSPRVALTSSVASGAVLTMIGNWAAGASTGTITEAGVFNALTTGTMYSRATFTAIPKGASDTLQITWTYTLTAS